MPGKDDNIMLLKPRGNVVSSEIHSLLHAIRSAREAQEADKLQFSRTIAVLRGQIAVLEQRVIALEAGGANR